MSSTIGGIEANRTLETPSRAEEATKSDQPDKKLLMMLAAIATNAWRARGKMVDSASGEPREDSKRFYRHVEGIFDSLTQYGIRTDDPVGRSFDSGMALKVVSFEPTPGCTRDEIKETIKPSVAWNGQLIQMAEVIVATPQEN
jgi:molecular chaperone GrpE (heat shock protein)